MSLVLTIPLSGVLDATLKAAGTNGQATLQEVQHGKNIVVKGKVVDKGGEAVIGANILVKGTSTGAVTDLDGNYTLSVSPNATLVFSYIGMKSQTVAVNNRKQIDVTLEDEAKAIDAVVVTALGIKRSQKALSYNVQEVKSDALTAVKDANFMNALSGKVAGVNINTSAAGVGGATRVVMRGVKSINSDNNALYVIDGVPIFNVNNGSTSGEFSSQPGGEGISDINPDDIESMSVLSGPAAAALYGSSAAQGVILITTKKGKEGKVKVEYSNSTTFSNPFVMPKFQHEYGNMPGSFKSWGAKGSAVDYDPAKFFNTGTNLINSVALTTGTDKNQTYLSAAATNSTGILPNNTYNRYNFTFRNSTKFLQDKLTLDLGAQFIIQNQKNLVAQGYYGNPLPALYLYPRGENFDEVRQYEVYDEARNISVQNWRWGNGGIDMENPYWQMHRKNREQDRQRYMLNGSLKWKIADWIDLTGRIRIDNSIGNNYDKFNAGTDLYWTSGSTKGKYSESKVEEKQMYSDLMANINKTFNDVYSLSANIGGSMSHKSYSSLSYGGPLSDIPNGFVVYNIDRNLGAPSASNWAERSFATFASAELGWKRLLYLTVTARNEWSSTLAGTEQLSYFFPSIGLSGVISDMMKLPEFINYMKARVSYADVGSPLPRNLTQTSYTWDSKSRTWVAPTYRPLGRLYPEKTSSWEAGLNMKFFKNALSLDVTWYMSDTKNQTLSVTTSPASGYSSMWVQSGNVRNYGMEFALGYRKEFGKLAWESNLTYSFNRNRIVELLDNYYDPITKETYSLPYLNVGNVRLVKNGSMGDLYTNSDFKRDAEGNIWIEPSTGNVERETLTTPRKIGSVLPDGNMGFRNSLSWNGLNLTALITARFGGHVTSATQMMLDHYGVSQTSADARNAGGVRVNKGLVDAEGYYNVVAGKNGITQEYLYDATNVRLQELSLGYTLPKKWLGNRMRLTASVIGRNLLMIYNHAPFDPEATASTGTYNQGSDIFMMPSLRSFGFSLKLEF